MTEKEAEGITLFSSYAVVIYIFVLLNCAFDIHVFYGIVSFKDILRMKPHAKWTFLRIILKSISEGEFKRITPSDAIVGDFGSYIKPMGHLNKYYDYALFGDLSHCQHH